MSNKIQIWSIGRENQVSFLSTPFKFTELDGSSQSADEGVQMLHKKQEALYRLLKTGICDIVKPDELRNAIISRTLMMIGKDEKFSKLDQGAKHKLVAMAIEQLPDSIQPRINMEAAPIRMEETKPAQAAPKPSAGQLALRANQAATAQTIKPKPVKQEPLPPPAREFVVTLEGDDWENAQIFFAGEEIYLDEPDQHLMLTTLLNRKASGNPKPITNATLAALLGSERRSVSAYPAMKKAMGEQVPGSSKALSYDSKTKTHKVTVPVSLEVSQPELKQEPIALPYDDRQP